MWIFTSQGFLSMVADYEQPGHLLVRARNRKHLTALFPGIKVTTTPARDYRFRISVPQAEAVRLVAAQVEGISYHNFKNSIPDSGYHDACSDVWGVMYDYQRRQS